MKGATETLALTKGELTVILQLLKRHIPDTVVWAYGSRVNGNARPSSDLDLVAFIDTEQTLAISTLREAFDESNLPFRIDLFVWDQIPDAFKAVIREKHVIIQNGHNRVNRENS